MSYTTASFDDLLMFRANLGGLAELMEARIPQMNSFGAVTELEPDAYGIGSEAMHNLKTFMGSDGATYPIQVKVQRIGGDRAESDWLSFSDALTFAGVEPQPMDAEPVQQ